MAIANYNDLSDSIISWSKRNDLDQTLIADFVQLTEMKLNTSDLRLLSEEDTEITVLETNDNYLSLPPRFKSMRSIRIQHNNARRHLRYVTPSRLQYVDRPGFPSTFTITNTIEFNCVPDSNYTVYVDHHRTLLPLDSTDGASTNNILTQYPSLYLYGCLEEVFNYVLDEKRAATYRQKFYQMIVNVNGKEYTGRYPADASPTPPGDTP